MIAIIILNSNTSQLPSTTNPSQMKSRRWNFRVCRCRGKAPEPKRPRSCAPPLVQRRRLAKSAFRNFRKWVKSGRIDIGQQVLRYYSAFTARRYIVFDSSWIVLLCFASMMQGTKRATRALRFNARAFSTSAFFAAPSSLRINADRLWETLHETCKWGAAHPYGEYVHSLNMIRISN